MKAAVRGDPSLSRRACAHAALDDGNEREGSFVLYDERKEKGSVPSHEPLLIQTQTVILRGGLCGGIV